MSGDPATDVVVGVMVEDVVVVVAVHVVTSVAVVLAGVEVTVLVVEVAVLETGRPFTLFISAASRLALISLRRTLAASSSSSILIKL